MVDFSFVIVIWGGGVDRWWKRARPCLLAPKGSVCLMRGNCPEPTRLRNTGHAKTPAEYISAMRVISLLLSIFEDRPIAITLVA